jgi:hypothetical protein
MQNVEFNGFPKIARLNREVIVTEKIDGTNAQIFIDEDGNMLTGSRNRWITPENDNYGFSRWANQHKDALLTLGPGAHFGEWWGSGIQRGYGLSHGEKRFSLFNTVRWCLSTATPKLISAEGHQPRYQQVLPSCVGLVPELWTGLFAELQAHQLIDKLLKTGSLAAPGFMEPEGIVVFHTASKICFKLTCKNDDKHKGAKNG